MTRYIDADSLYMNLVKMKDFGELTAKKAIRVVENAPTVDLRKVTQDYASDTTIDVIPVAWIEERISNAKEAGQTLIAQMWQELIDGYNRESK